MEQTKEQKTLPGFLWKVRECLRLTDFISRYFATSSAARASICASAAALAAERMVTTFSQRVMFFMLSSSARISFAAMGAQVPFSIRPTVRFWKFLVLRWVSRASIGGKRKPS